MISMPETHGQPLPETIEDVQAAAGRRGATPVYSQVPSTLDAGGAFAPHDEQ